MPLDSETIAALLRKSAPKYKPVRIAPLCSGCNSKLDENGYCQNSDCLIDQAKETFECNGCGHCETPNKCVASEMCIECGAEVAEMCRKPDGSVTSYHEVRWETVKLAHGVYFK